MGKLIFAYVELVEPLLALLKGEGVEEFAVVFWGINNGDKGVVLLG